MATPSTRSSESEPSSLGVDTRIMPDENDPKAAFPNGIPNTYAIESNSGSDVKYIDHLPCSFYTNPPPNCAALFSTLAGRRPFRKMEHVLPGRSVKLWRADEVQEVCNRYRRMFYQYMPFVTKPTNWHDLWNYFDAFDLFRFGATNLWNVINHLAHENSIILADLRLLFIYEVGFWSDQWIHSGCNCDKLLEAEGLEGAGILNVLSLEDWDSLGDLRQPEVEFLVDALTFRRNQLLGVEPCPTGFPANTLEYALNNNKVHNWLGTYRQECLLKLFFKCILTSLKQLVA